MRLLVLHGPNMRLLGTRQPELYGTTTLEQLNKELHAEGKKLGADLAIHQSNFEGQLLDWLEEYRPIVGGCVINPGALTHTSIALLDGVLAFGKPVVEVHLTEPRDREEFRHVSYVGNACAARFAGEGKESYMKALRWVAEQTKTAK